MLPKVFITRGSHLTTDNEHMSQRQEQYKDFSNGYLIYDMSD